MTNNTAVDTYISDGNITLFFGSHTNTFKEDILHSSLLGQLAANVNSTTPESWFHSYKKTLSSIFWATKSNAIQSPEVKSASLLDLAKISLSSYMSTTDLAQLTQIFSHVKKLPVDCKSALALLNKVQPKTIDKTQSPITTSPLLTIIREDKMAISLIISFEITKPAGINIIDEEFSLKKATQPLISQWTTYLGEENYASIRAKVIEKLGSNINTKLFNIENSQP